MTARIIEFVLIIGISLMLATVLFLLLGSLWDVTIAPKLEVLIRALVVK